jgi:hypothetical protein
MTIESILRSFYQAYSDAQSPEPRGVLTEAFYASDVGALILQSRLVGMIIESMSLQGTSIAASSSSGRKSIQKSPAFRSPTCLQISILFRSVNLESRVGVSPTLQLLTTAQPLGP